MRLVIRQVMKIILLTYGTRGDVQPYLALGLGLKARGHEIRIVTSERFRGFITGYGLAFAPMNDDLLAILDTDEGKAMIEDTRHIGDQIRMALSIWKRVGPMQKAILDDGWAATRDEAPDLLIYHPKAYGSPHYAEKLGIPSVFALPIPMMLPTRDLPNIGFVSPGWGWFNRFTYTLVDMIMAIASARMINSWRSSVGLQKARTLSLSKRPDGCPQPAVVCVSPNVIAQPSDWPDLWKMIGYWFLDTPIGWTPPEDLQTFLDAGDPPVYIGFGSMTGRQPERLAEIAVEALRRSGKRGILATGWGGLKPGDLPDTIFSVDQVPHDWLFPNMAAIVHHGGAGTTAAALRSGTPSVIVPFFGDQPFWGKTIHNLGVGTRPIPQKRLTAENLSEALIQA